MLCQNSPRPAARGSRLRALFISCLGLTLLGWLACSREPTSPVERGRGTFVRNCSACHGMDGRGTLPPGVALPSPPRNLTDPVFQSSHTDDELLFSLRNGKGTMPPFGVLLSDDKLREVVAYVRTLSQPAPAAPQ